MISFARDSPLSGQTGFLAVAVSFGVLFALLFGLLFPFVVAFNDDF